MTGMRTTLPAMETLLACRQAWQRTNDQLTIEADDLTSLPVSDRSPSEVRGTNGSGAPATGSSSTTNGDRRSTLPGSAAAASQETS